MDDLSSLSINFHAWMIISVQKFPRVEPSLDHCLLSLFLSKNFHAWNEVWMIISFLSMNFHVWMISF